MQSTMQTPKITAIAPWFGGKRTLAPAIVDELGKHHSYFEPFCGSMAVLFAKEPSRQETVCDLHGELTNLAWILQEEKTAIDLYNKLQRTLFCESLFEKSKNHLLTHSALPEGERAYWFFIHSWAGRSGCCGSSKMSFQLAVRWTPGGGSATTRFRSAVESIPAWHERLKNVVILNRNAFDILPSIPDEEGISIYCDPPYLHSTRNGNADGGYKHDFEEYDGLFSDQDDHGHLAKQLNRFHETRVIVSYYDHPRLEAMYTGWNKLLHYRQKNLHVQNRRGAGKCEAPEVLLINGPSFAKDAN